MDAAEALNAFRAEMTESQTRSAELAAAFLRDSMFEDAAKCAMKAEILKWVLGRIPPAAPADSQAAPTS